MIGFEAENEAFRSYKLMHENDHSTSQISEGCVGLFDDCDKYYDIYPKSVLSIVDTYCIRSVK